MLFSRSVDRNGFRDFPFVHWTTPHSGSCRHNSALMLPLGSTSSDLQELLSKTAKYKWTSQSFILLSTPSPSDTAVYEKYVTDTLQQLCQITRELVLALTQGQDLARKILLICHLDYFVSSFISDPQLLHSIVIDDTGGLSQNRMQKFHLISVKNAALLFASVWKLCGLNASSTCTDKDVELTANLCALLNQAQCVSKVCLFCRAENDKQRKYHTTSTVRDASIVGVSFSYPVTLRASRALVKSLPKLQPLAVILALATVVLVTLSTYSVHACHLASIICSIATALAVAGTVYAQALADFRSEDVLHMREQLPIYPQSVVPESPRQLPQCGVVLPLRDSVGLLKLPHEALDTVVQIGFENNSPFLVVYWNKCAEECTGIKQADIVRKPLASIIGADQIDLLLRLSSSGATIPVRLIGEVGRATAIVDASCTAARLNSSEDRMFAVLTGAPRRDVEACQLSVVDVFRKVVTKVADMDPARSTPTFQRLASTLTSQLLSMQVEREALGRETLQAALADVVPSLDISEFPQKSFLCDNRLCGVLAAVASTSRARLMKASVSTECPALFFRFSDFAGSSSAESLDHIPGIHAVGYLLSLTDGATVYVAPALSPIGAYSSPDIPIDTHLCVFLVIVTNPLQRCHIVGLAEGRGHRCISVLSASEAAVQIDRRRGGIDLVLVSKDHPEMELIRMHLQQLPLVEVVAKDATEEATTSKSNTSDQVLKTPIEPARFSQLVEWAAQRRQRSGNLTSFITLREIGQGGQSVVFILENQLTKGRMAGKRFKAEATEAFKKEESLLRRLKHDNIVSFIDVDVTQSTPWLLLELGESDLLKRVKDRSGPLQLSELVPLAAQLFAAVGYLHSNNIAHQDIKPENVICFDRPVVKLSDFASAAQIESPPAPLHPTTARNSAPERFDLISSGDAFTADVWSVGTVLLQCLHLLPKELENVTTHSEACSLFRSWVEGDSNPFIDAARRFAMNSSLEHDEMEEFADMIEKTMCFDPKNRLTARELTLHPFVKHFQFAASSSFPTPHRLPSLVGTPVEIIVESRRPHGPLSFGSSSARSGDIPGFRSVAASGSSGAS